MHTGSQPSQLLNRPVKSTEKIWPQTDVILKRALNYNKKLEELNICKSDIKLLAQEILKLIPVNQEIDHSIHKQYMDYNYNDANIIENFLQEL